MSLRTEREEKKKEDVQKTVSVEILWYTATEDVPLIKKQIEAIWQR